MDHLPIPERFRSQVPPVPWLQHAPPYDRNGFEGFPERIGMSEDVIMAEISAEWPSDRPPGGPPMIAGVPHREYIESVLQEWLWFGPMHEFEIACGVGKDDADGSFTVMRDGKLVLDTTPLGAYVRKVLIVELSKPPLSWDQERLKKMSSTMLMAERERVLFGSTSEQARMKYAQTTTGITRSLQRVRDMTRIVLDQIRPILRFEIVMSIDILCSTLRHLVEELWSQPIHLRPSSRFYTIEFQGKMLSQNWCPARIEPLTIEDLPFRYIFSLLPSSAQVSHTSCDRRACRRRPKDPGNVKPSHLTSDCECEVISFDETALIGVLQRGGNPGVLKVLSQNGRVSYKIVDIRGRDFIAISHVFSQGMGNSKANALPLCQIEKLWGFVEELGPRSSALWIDTISVPVSEEWKRLAISKLREVYSMAAKVLVVDCHLLDVGDHWLERSFQVLASEWMRRLWTLQEGRLTRRLYFRFKDEAVSVDNLMVMNATPSYDSNSCLSNCLTATERLLGKYFRVEAFVGQTFLNIIEDLSHRSVTYPSDEPICIATLLGLRLENFHPYPTMIDIYRSVENIPQNIIFVGAPRLKFHGFRWAPATFLEQNLMVFPPEEEPPAKLTPRGLKVTKDLLITRGFKFEHNLSTTIYLVSCSLEGELVQFEISRHGFDDEQVKTINNAAIILQNTENLLVAHTRSILVSLIDIHENNSSFVSPVGLVGPLIMGNQKDTRYARFEACMDVWRITPSTSRELERRIARPGQKTCHISGELVLNVKICVD
jgi:hypothetical protein